MDDDEEYIETVEIGKMVTQNSVKFQNIFIMISSEVKPMGNINHVYMYKLYTCMILKLVKCF